MGRAIRERQLALQFFDSSLQAFLGFLVVDIIIHEFVEHLFGVLSLAYTHISYSKVHASRQFELGILHRSLVIILAPFRKSCLNLLLAHLCHLLIGASIVEGKERASATFFQSIREKGVFRRIARLINEMDTKRDDYSRCNGGNNHHDALVEG